MLNQISRFVATYLNAYLKHEVYVKDPAGTGSKVRHPENAQNAFLIVGIIGIKFGIDWLGISF
jgi:hypothetical protein